MARVPCHGGRRREPGLAGHHCPRGFVAGRLLPPQRHLLATSANPGPGSVRAFWFFWGVPFLAVARILFCEDNPTIRRLLEVALRGTPYDVQIAPDGAAGLALAERWRPDLIVTDISMPDMDGFALVAAVRAHPALASVPVLVMSAT